MAFPQTQLDLRVDLLLGGAWTDITEDVRISAGVTISRGRADEASRPDAQTCSLKLDNRDGKYSPRNPTSPHYGILGRNAPLRVGVGTPSLAAGAADLADSTSLVAPTVTAEVASMQLVVWGATPAGNITLPGGFTAGTERDGADSTWAAGNKTVSAGATGTATATHSVTATAQCAVNVVVPAGSSVAGFSVIEDSALTTVPITSAAAGTTIVAFHGWSSDPDDEMIRPPSLASDRPPAWVLLADSGPSEGPRVQAWSLYVDTALGATDIAFDALSGADNFGRVYVVTGATPYYARFAGEVSTWPATWDLAGADVAAPIVASGARRRLGSGATPLRSSVYRRFVSEPGIVGYWPMEDVDGSESFSSATPGVSPMSFVGSPDLASDDGFSGSTALPTFASAGAQAKLPVTAVTDQYAVGALVHLPSGLTDDATIFTVQATGTIETWTVRYDTTAPGFRVDGFDADGTTIETASTSGWTVSPVGARGLLILRVYLDGGDPFWSLDWTAINSAGDLVAETWDGTPVPSYTVGRVSRVKVGAGTVPLNNAVSVGHLFVGSSSLVIRGFDHNAINGFNSFPADTRLRDLCREANLLLGGRILGALEPATEAMGPALPRTFLELVDEAADADGGVLIEPRGFLGFQYRDRASKFSQASALTLTYSTPGHVGHPLEPVDDDQGTVNDVTVTRIGGSSARAELTEGPMSVLPPPSGVGRYDSSFDLSLYRDSQATDRASWILHLGTVDEARWPTIVTRLEAVPSLIPTFTALEVGDLITLTGLPAWVPPGPTELILEGYTETLGAYSWEFVGNYSPGSPWRTMIADDTRYGRLDSEGATLAEDLTTAETFVDVISAAGHPRWITTASHPTEFPFDITVGGEVMTVTASVTAGSVETFTVTRSVNGVVKTHSTGATVRLAEPIYVA